MTTAIWQEWKKSILHHFNISSKWWLVILSVVFGVFLPWQMGKTWLETPMTIIFFTWMPLLLMTSWMADTFIKRDRNNDKPGTGNVYTTAGKMIPTREVITVVAGIWILVLAVWLMGGFVSNITHWGEKFQFYTLASTVGVVFLSLLSAALAISTSILVYQKTANIQRSAQTISYIILVITLLPWLPIIGISLLPPPWQKSIEVLFMEFQMLPVTLIVIGILLLINIAVIAVVVSHIRNGSLSNAQIIEKP